MDGETYRRFQRHEQFDLLLPCNELLSEHVGLKVKKRSICHEWPLSCVEKIVFEGGVEKYCKTMKPPSMEVQVYSSIQSPLLVSYRVIHESYSCSTMVLDAFQGEPLRKEVVLSQGVPTYLNNLAVSLKSISGVGPIFNDLSTEESIGQHIDTMLERLGRIYGSSSPTPIDSGLLSLMRNFATSSGVRDALMEDALYSNGDLSADNILVNGHETRIIDWQFPRLSSIQVEAVNLLTSLGLDPTRYLSTPVVVAGILCKIRWLVECADVWLPSCDYREEISGLMQTIASLKGCKYPVREPL